MEYMVYFKVNDTEYSLKYNSGYRNKSKENKADAELAIKNYCKQNNIKMEKFYILETKNITKRRRSEATKTSAEAKMRWENKTYKKYTISLNGGKYVLRLRKEDDKDLVEYIEAKKKDGVGITELVRYALSLLKEHETDRQN